MLQTAPVLRFYDVSKPITIQGDASSTGLGSCLLQEGRPVAYASRALTETEINSYSQIEKEMLAVVFSMEKFHTYVYGKSITVESDHKPLISIMKKSINNAPRRLQRMLLRLQAYDINLQYRPGTQMIFGDYFSRAVFGEIRIRSVNPICSVR